MSSETNRNQRLLLVFPMNMAGHYLRCLEFCKRLEDQFQIRFAYSSTYQSFIRDSGYETFDIENFDAKAVTDAASRFDFSWINQATIEIILDSQIEAINEYKPDMVLGDTSFPLKMAADKTGTRFVSLLNGYMTKYYKLLRQVPHNHPAYKYSKKIPKRIFEQLTRQVEYRSFRKIHEPFRIIRKERKLSPQHYLLDELEGDINMICDLPELFPQKELPAKYHFVGPLYYRSHEEEKEILDFLGNHHPNILVTLGSTGSYFKESFFDDPIFENYKIIISDSKNSIHSKSNIMFKSFINNLAIMNKIDIVICHGGNGTVYQALSNGVPVLCIPSNFEQEWNTQRIDELGLGVHINELSVRKLAGLIDFWIEHARVTHIFTEIKEEINMFTEKPVNLTS